MPKKTDGKAISREQVEKFNLLYPLLRSLLEEVGEFSKKKQDGVLNGLKVKTINRILSDVQALLGNDPSVNYLDLLDDQTLPQNSDATLILGQFKAAMIQFKNRHYGWNGINHGWTTAEGFLTDADVTEG